MFLDFPGLAGKWLPMLTEVAPGIGRVALVWDATTSPTRVTAAKAAAQGLVIGLQVVEIRNAINVDGSLTAAVNGGLDGLRPAVLTYDLYEFHPDRGRHDEAGSVGSTSGRAESGASKEVG